MIKPKEKLERAEKHCHGKEND
jgi:hypothetical protein